MAVPQMQWNIFARELDAILRAHGSRIGLLDNHEEIALHPQVVQRLLRSLHSPKPLVVLNPDVLTNIIQVYAMSIDERRRLKAAILATAVQRILMDRVDASLVLMISNNVFDLLLAAFVAHPALESLVRQSSFTSPPNGTEATPLFEALDVLDQCTVELHLTLQTESDEERRRMALQTYQAFGFALTLLEQCSQDVRQAPDWEYWYREAQSGRQQVYRVLEGAN